MGETLLYISQFKVSTNNHIIQVAYLCLQLSLYLVYLQRPRRSDLVELKCLIQGELQVVKHPVNMCDLYRENLISSRENCQHCVSIPPALPTL